MKTAVIYARYSSERQTEQSIEGQLSVCHKYAEENDILIVDTYIDRAMTGTNDLRDAFQQMMRDSSKQAWDYVLVYKLDRFSRDKYEATIHKHTLKEHGIKLVSAMENIPETPEGIILESLLEGMNQYFSMELSQKVKRGMNESRKKGNFTGGSILFGLLVLCRDTLGRLIKTYPCVFFILIIFVLRKVDCTNEIIYYRYILHFSIEHFFFLSDFYAVYKRIYNFRC